MLSFKSLSKCLRKPVTIEDTCFPGKIYTGSHKRLKFIILEELRQGYSLVLRTFRGQVHICVELLQLNGKLEDAFFSEVLRCCFLMALCCRLVVLRQSVLSRFSIIFFLGCVVQKKEKKDRK